MLHAMLKQHQERLSRSSKRKKKRPSSAHATSRRETKSLSVKGGEVEVVTTVRAKSLPRNLEQTRTSVAKQNLDILRGMTKLQTSLRKDDFSWD